jgi:hypothetical protein
VNSATDFFHILHLVLKGRVREVIKLRKKTLGKDCYHKMTIPTSSDLGYGAVLMLAPEHVGKR